MLNELLRLQHKNPKRSLASYVGNISRWYRRLPCGNFRNGIYTKINILGFETYPYDETTRASYSETCNPETGTVEVVCQLNFFLESYLQMRLHLLRIRRIFQSALSTSLAPTDRSSIISQSNNHGKDRRQRKENRRSEVRSNESNSNTVDIDAEAFKKRNVDLTHSGLRSKLGNLPSLPRETGVTTVADFRPGEIWRQGGRERHACLIGISPL